MTKAEIRKIYLQKRIALQEAEFGQLNQQLCDHFFSSIDLSAISVLHTFIPIEKQKEVDTWMIIDRVRREHPNVRIAIPRINNQTSSIESFYFEGREQLEKNTWGILEPKQGVPVPVEKIDIVLVPMLAFDTYGNRVGYGRGFYDKFLATCRDSCKKIGLSFFPPVDSIEGLGSYDLPVDLAITPQGALSLTQA
jgi:5-formyltetrahydrofolate cyclo-ligase